MKKSEYLIRYLCATLCMALLIAINYYGDILIEKQCGTTICDTGKLVSFVLFLISIFVSQKLYVKLINLK